ATSTSGDSTGGRTSASPAAAASAAGAPTSGDAGGVRRSHAVAERNPRAVANTAALDTVTPVVWRRVMDSRLDGRGPAASRASRLADLLKEHVGRLLRDHVDRHDDEEPGDAREDRRVDHAQAR